MQLWEWRICKNVRNAEVSAKTNKTFTRPALWTHMVRTRSSHHATHRCTKQPFTTLHLFWSMQENHDRILSHLQSSTQQSRPLQMSLEVKEGKRVKAVGKSRQGTREERLVISLLAKRCESWGPMRASGVAATFWAERQVKAGGGATRRLTCLLLEEGRKRDRLN